MHNLSFTIFKAIAIMLVVIAHSAAPTFLSSFAYMVGVPAFFVLSGYFFNLENLDNTTDFVVRRGKRLYIPFLLCGTVFLILHNFTLNTLKNQKKHLKVEMKQGCKAICY